MFLPHRHCHTWSDKSHFGYCRAVIRAVTHSSCYGWVCFIFPWCYGWICQLLIEFTHEVTNLLRVWRIRLHVTKILMTALYCMTLSHLFSTLGSLLFHTEAAQSEQTSGAIFYLQHQPSQLLWSWNLAALSLSGTCTSSVITNLV